MTTGVSRDQRRERTQAAILTAARELFAESGFERTTIRGVAARAGIDPALVMQYYGSKERLFAAAAQWGKDETVLAQARLADVPTAALRDLFRHFEDEGERTAASALMRNCLTYPAAASVMRDEILCQRVQDVAGKLDGDDAELRAALFGAAMMGLAMARYLLELPGLATAAREDVERLLGPALRVLLEGPGTPEPDGS